MARCQLCGKDREHTRLHHCLRHGVTAVLGRRRPAINPVTDAICDGCMRDAAAEAAATWLTQDKGQLTDLDLDVIAAIRQDRVLAADGDEVIGNTDMTAGERVEDRVVPIIGTWKFPAALLLGVGAWVAVNVTWMNLDPFPTVMLAGVSAVLATLAAVQAPIILMSQRRQRTIDRRRAVNDYRVNLKAELEIRAIGERLDAIAGTNDQPPDVDKE